MSNIMRDLEKDYEELCHEGLVFIQNCDLLADARLEVAGSLGSLEKTAAWNLQAQELRVKSHNLCNKMGRLYIRSADFLEVSNGDVKQRLLELTLYLLDGLQKMDDRIQRIVSPARWDTVSATEALESLLSALITHSAINGEKLT